MKKVIFVFGLIGGTMVAVFSIAIMMMNNAEIINFDNGYYYGYSAIIIALSMVFFGVKSYRDNYQHGAIKFGKALVVGLLIALSASVTWGILSEIHYQIDPELSDTFINRYSDFEIAKMQRGGAPQVEIDAKVKEIEDMREDHKSPIMRFVMTVGLLFPIGIIVSLISAAILRKREILPA